MSKRAEASLSDNHAREAYSEVELAIDEKGKLCACGPPLGKHGSLYTARSAPTSRTVTSCAACPACTTSSDRLRHGAALFHQNHRHGRPTRRRTARGELHPQRVIDRGRAGERIDSDKTLARRTQPDQDIECSTRPRSDTTIEAARSRPCSERRWPLAITTASSSAGVRPPGRENNAGFGNLLHAGARRGFPLRGDELMKFTRREADDEPQGNRTGPGPATVFNPSWRRSRIKTE